MQRVFFLFPAFILLFLFCFSCGTYQAGDNISEPSAISLSQDLLSGQKAGKSVAQTVDQLAKLDPRALANELDSRDKKLAFWINIYNGYIQYILTRQPELWESRNDVFSGDRIRLAGEMISPELIEHGIIRGGEAKLGLGFIPKLFTNKFERTFRIDGGDARIHFALNCGAIDCPPVEIYAPQTIDERLDHRSRVYLKKHTTIDPESETITHTPLFSWFKGDFNDYGGIDGFLHHFGIINEAQKDYSRETKSYDWTLATNVYAND